jgi:hypothetical protein
MLGRSLKELRGRDFLASLPGPVRQAAVRLPDQAGEPGIPFECVVRGTDGTGREVVCSTFAVELSGILFFLIAIAWAWQLIGVHDTGLAAMIGDLVQEHEQQPTRPKLPPYTRPPVTPTLPPVPD